jgi:hypothetical protein
MTKQIDTILQRQMTRKEFLGATALGLGSILGFSTIIRMLTGKSLDHHIIHDGKFGYGRGLYRSSKAKL